MERVDSSTDATQEQQSTSSKILEDLCQNLLNLKTENRELANENAFLRELKSENLARLELVNENTALKKQIHTNNLTWKTERNKMMKEIESLTAHLCKCNWDLTTLNQQLISAKAREKELKKELREMRLQVKEGEVDCPSEDLQQAEREKCQDLESYEEKRGISILLHWASSEKQKPMGTLEETSFIKQEELALKNAKQRIGEEKQKRNEMKKMERK
nr:PREDICTED: uncharacterized protein LOC109642376 [Paralichthys olivaceus]